MEAIRARVMVLSGPDDVAERLALATRAVPLASALSSPLADMWARLWRMEAAYQLDGQMLVVDEEFAQIAQIARTTRLPLAGWHLLRWQAARATLATAFVEARSLSAQALEHYSLGPCGLTKQASTLTIEY